jgi:hypothetical protein
LRCREGRRKRKKRWSQSSKKRERERENVKVAEKKTEIQMIIWRELRSREGLCSVHVSERKKNFQVAT